jgi:hypothetical protein
VSTQNEPLNTASITQFLNQVKSADASRAKDIRMDIQQAKNLAFTLGLVMTRLNGDLEQILAKKSSGDDEVIQIQIGSANSGW